MDKTRLDDDEPSVWPAAKPDPRAVSLVQLQQISNAVLGEVVEYMSLLSDAIDMSDCYEDRDDDHDCWVARQSLLQQLISLLDEAAAMSTVLDVLDIVLAVNEK